MTEAAVQQAAPGSASATVRPSAMRSPRPSTIPPTAAVESEIRDLFAALGR